MKNKPDHLKTEQELLQTPAENYLKSLGIEYIHKQNSTRQKYRKGTNVNMKRIPDLIIFLTHGLTLFVEFKMPSGKLNKGQIEYMNYLLHNGHRYYIIESIGLFKKLIDKYKD